MYIKNANIWPGYGKQFPGSILINVSGTIEKIIPEENSVSSDLIINPEKYPIIDAKNGTVIPAFTDCHCHLSGIVRQRMFVDLSTAKSSVEAINLLLEAASKVSEDKWVIGSSYDETKFTDHQILSRKNLDIIKNPVIVGRVCYHTRVINSAALNILKDSLLNVDQNKILRDESGEPNGIILEEAATPLSKVLDSIELSDEDFTKVFNEYLSYGVAEVHAIGTKSGLSENIYTFQRLRQSNKLPIRIVCYLVNDKLPIGSYFGDDFVAYGGLKIFMDGSLGSHTAALRQKYACSDTCGMLIHTDEEMVEIFKNANSRRQQIMAHCIGDRGIEQIVSTCEKVKPLLPLKLTHVQICPKDIQKRIANINAIVDVQMHMLISDASHLETWLGKERAKDVFPIKSLIELGVTVTGSSDGPIEPLNPMTGVWAAVARDDNRNNDLNIDECIPLEEALKMYTANAQKLIGREDRKGTLEAGKVADIAIFDRDIFTVEKHHLKECKIVTTIVNGKIAFQAQ